jgi:hypothetical protein
VVNWFKLSSANDVKGMSGLLPGPEGDDKKAPTFGPIEGFSDRRKLPSVELLNEWKTKSEALRKMLLLSPYIVAPYFPLPGELESNVSMSGGNKEENDQMKSVAFGTDEEGFR